MPRQVSMSSLTPHCLLLIHLRKVIDPASAKIFAAAAPPFRINLARSLSALLIAAIAAMFAESLPDSDDWY
jgi:hypothetical protein